MSGPRVTTEFLETVLHPSKCRGGACPTRVDLRLAQMMAQEILEIRAAYGPAVYQDHRRETLLRAAYDLLRRSCIGPYVQDATSILVHYDGFDSDGSGLMTEIAHDLGLDDNEEPIPLCDN